MIPVFQNMSVANDGYGNCFNACVASILEIRLCDVAPIYPRVVVSSSDGADVLEVNNEWLDQWCRWLATQGYKFLFYRATKPPKGYSIASGHSDRIYPAGHPQAGMRISHAVVAFDGIPVHDPFPLSGWFGDITRYYAIVRIDTNSEKP